MWSRKSAMLGSLAVAMYLLGLTLRNEQLVTIAVVVFVFLTWAALFGGHADVASSGRRAEEWSGEEGLALSSVSAMRKLSSARLFEDGELNVTLRMQNESPLPKILEVKDRVPEVMRIKEGSNYILMELGPRRETFIEYTLECPLRGFYSIGPVAVRIQDPFGLFHKEKEMHVYDDFLVFPKMEDLKETFVKSRVPKIFTGAVNIRQPGPGSEFYSLREYRKQIADKKSNFFLTYNNKTVKDNQPLSFTLTGNDCIKCRRQINKTTTREYLPPLEGEKYPTQKLPLDQRWSARKFDFSQVFDALNTKSATKIKLDWFYNISSWQEYRNFLGSEHQIEKPYKPLTGPYACAKLIE